MKTVVTVLHTATKCVDMCLKTRRWFSIFSLSVPSSHSQWVIFLGFWLDTWNKICFRQFYVLFYSIIYQQIPQSWLVKAFKKRQLLRLQIMSGTSNIIEPNTESHAIHKTKFLFRFGDTRTINQLAYLCQFLLVHLFSTGTGVFRLLLGKNSLGLLVLRLALRWRLVDPRVQIQTAQGNSVTLQSYEQVLVGLQSRQTILKCSVFLMSWLTLQEQALSSAPWGLQGWVLRQTEHWPPLLPLRPSAAVSGCTWPAAGCKTPKDKGWDRCEDKQIYLPVSFSSFSLFTKLVGKLVYKAKQKISIYTMWIAILPSPAPPGWRSGQTAAACLSSVGSFPVLLCCLCSPPGS